SATTAGSSALPTPASAPATISARSGISSTSSPRVRASGRRGSATAERLGFQDAPGALDPLVKEMLYIAVSATNNCEYCIASHTASARKQGMTDAQLAELLAVVGMANETNRLANGYRVEVDERFNPKFG